MVSKRARLPVIALLLLSVSGLSGCYYLQAARGQLEIVRKREPITEILADPATPPDLRRRLELVRDAREYAAEALALPDNGSYRTYADLGREYVVWSVFAAKEFSVEPRRWCFPVAGCVAYRGYFDRADAEAEAAALAADGYDTYVSGVAAYSTLGRLRDPVLNTMMGWSELRLVQTLFHELAHQRLYVPDDTEFNESFATVVGREGVRRWLQAREAGPALDELARRTEWQTAWREAVMALRERLAVLYASGLSAPDMRREKQRLFAELAASPAAPPNPPSNNAELIPAIAYHGLVPQLLGLLDACGGALPCFYERAEALATIPPEERRQRLADYL
ncbi:MAG: aminopeptidase [Gammaproteobacteria bacterium]|jgi:predicted aminopeptidase